MMNLLAWHFVRDDLTLQDGQRVAVGETYRLPHGVEPVLCEIGYHASQSALDALQYAPGSMLERVELSGTLIVDDDKHVASARTTLALHDVATQLRLFACDCAERALAHVTAPDPRSIAAVVVARRYADGQVTKEELDTARTAAWAATTASAWHSAAATAAAWAADTAAWASARAAAWDATHAARRVAFAAAGRRAIARRAVEAVVARAVACAAASSVAWDAERAWQRDELERRMLALFEESEG